MGAFDVVEFQAPPMVQVEILAVVTDSPSCLAAARVLHRIDLDETSDEAIGVVERRGGIWGFSYTGEGWICDGPHPLSS
jgi:hypothetical protein